MGALVLPSSVNATSGCCSGKHNGVNCSAGPQSNGHLICADGWRGSSCKFADNCSGGYVAPAPTTRPATPRPITATTKPSTPKPTAILTVQPTSAPTETPTSAPEVKTIVAVPTATPTPKTSDVVEGFGILGAMGTGAFFGIRGIYRKIFKR